MAIETVIFSDSLVHPGRGMIMELWGHPVLSKPEPKQVKFPVSWWVVHWELP